MKDHLLKMGVAAGSWVLQKSHTTISFCKIYIFLVEKTITVLAGIITIIAIVFAWYQYNVSQKNFEYSADPQISLYPSAIYNPESDMIYAPSGSTTLVLQNNFMGDLTRVNVYQDMVGVIQDRGTHDMWICDDWDSNASPVASISELGARSTYDFTININQELEHAGSYFKPLRSLITWLPVLRIRISYQKAVNDQPFEKDFYFLPYGAEGESNMELFPYPNPFFSSQHFYTKDWQLIPQQQVLNMITDATFTDSDPSCFVEMYLKHYKKTL